jgi:hypothetical protein
MSVFFQPPIAISGGGGGSSSVTESKTNISMLNGTGSPVFANSSLTMVELSQNSLAAAQMYSANMQVTTVGTNVTQIKLGQMQSSQNFPLQNTSPSSAYFVNPASALIEVRFFVNVNGEFIVESVGSNVFLFNTTGIWQIPLMCATWIATT